MKFLLFICLFIYCSDGAMGQDYNEYATVDEKAFRIPDTITNSTASIAAYIQSNFTTEKERLRAIYTWVTANIRYDTDSMYYKKWGESAEEKMAAILRRRKGVCENYAALFTDIAVQCGIQTIVVNGYTRQSGFVNWAGHSWCAVCTNKEWFLCDPTWDEGVHPGTKYFLVQPDQFIESHMPYDPLWQLLSYPISHKEFRQGMSSSRKRLPVFNYVDSVNVFLQSDTLQQFEAASRRMKQAGLENDKLKIWHAWNEMKVAIIYGDEDRSLYNSAVAELNKASAIFNKLIEYRNNNFIPARSADKINAGFDSITAAIAAAYKNIAAIGNTVENLQYDTGGLKERLNALSARVKEQKAFFKIY